MGDRASERREGRAGRGGKLRGEPWLLFAYRLASHLKILDVEQALRTTSVRQIRRWCAAYRLEPFGNEWRRTARQTSVLAAAEGRKIPEDFEEMFLPTYDPSRPTQTPEEMARELAKLKNLTKSKKRKDAT